MSDTSDEQLLRAFANGEVAASQILVDTHLPWMLNLAARMLNNHTEAEDIAQECFLVVWNCAAGWQEQGATFKTWLYQVVLNKCRDRLRKSEPEYLDQTEMHSIASGMPDTEHTLIASDVSARINSAIASLPTRQREAILLCHYHELSNIDAATAMNCSVDALESVLSRARRTLKALLLSDKSELLAS